MSDFAHFAKHFVCSSQNSQGVARSYQGGLTIETWNSLFLLLRSKWYVIMNWLLFSSFLVTVHHKQWVLFDLESFVLISDVSVFSFFIIELIRKIGIHWKLREIFRHFRHFRRFRRFWGIDLAISECLIRKFLSTFFPNNTNAVWDEFW